MMGLSKDQWFGLLRQVVPILGGMLVALGWVPESVIISIKANMETILAGVSSIIVAASAVWAAIANSKKSIIASATQMPEVDSQKLAQAIEDPQLKAVAKDMAT